MALQVRPESTQPESFQGFHQNPSVRWGVDSADSIRARGLGTALEGRIYGCDLSCNRRSQEGLAQRGASIYGNFNARSIAWKRGSLRSGSRNGSVLKYSSPGSRSRMAVSSHSSALP